MLHTNYQLLRSNIIVVYAISAILYVLMRDFIVVAHKAINYDKIKDMRGGSGG